MLMRFVDWAFRDRHTGRVVVAQWPNLWLWVFIAASLVEMVAASDPRVAVVARVVALAFLAIWAGDELLRGVNPWRRGLGAAVLIGSLVRLVL